MGVIPAVVLLYVVLTPVGVLTYCIGHTAIPPHIYVHIPIRVGIHIAWRAQETGVGQHIKLLRSYTIDLVYTYITKYIYGKKHKMTKNVNLFL